MNDQSHHEELSLKELQSISGGWCGNDIVFGPLGPINKPFPWPPGSPGPTFPEPDFPQDYGRVENSVVSRRMSSANALMNRINPRIQQNNFMRFF